MPKASRRLPRYAPFRTQAEHDEAARSLERLLPPDTLFTLLFGRPPHSEYDNCPKDDFHRDVAIENDNSQKDQYRFFVFCELSLAIHMGEALGFTCDDFLMFLIQKLRETPITDPLWDRK